MLETGSLLGRYKILGKLGSGGMADVYLVEDTQLGRQVALKILPPEFARDAERTARFEKEVRSAAQLHHPHIITLFEVGHDDGLHYYTMAYLPGGDLKQKIRQGLSARQSVEYLKQVAGGLDFAHRKGFIHRDIKPENILFDEDGHAVLSDLGIAKAVGSGTKMTGTGMSIGTPHYMSPEQARGLDVDGRSDLYSLGVVFYEMLTGQVPYDAQDSFAVAYKHINDPVPQLPKNLGKLQPLMDRLLAKDSVQRYQRAGELIEAIDQVLSGQSLPRTAEPRKQPAPATKVMPSAFKSEKKGGGLRWAIGGALLAVLVVGGILLSQQGTNKPRPALGGGSTAMVPASQAQPEPAPVTPPEVQTPLAKGSAILQVSSDPTGAEVFLNDQKIGLTPLTRDDLPAGNHLLRLVQTYYIPFESNLVLENDKVFKQSIQLERGVGSVTVLSEPSGSIVYLDGKQQKEKTPLTLGKVAAGPHTIKVHNDTYYDVEQSVEVLPDKTSKLNVTLNGGHLVNYQGEWLEPEEVAKRKAEAERKRVEAERLAAERKAAEERRLAEQRSQAEEAQKRSEFESLLADVDAALKAFKKTQAIANAKAALQLYPGDAKAKELLAKAESWQPPKFYTDPATGMEFVLVKGGCYRMGSNSGDSDEKPVHEVCVDAFYLGKYEVTQAQYQKIAVSNPSYFQGNDRPVEKVSWNDAQSFIKKLNGLNDKGYRLPTEAEWEFAARSGGKDENWAGTSNRSSLGDYAWYDGNSGNKTHPVGQKKPNGLGLYDMSGNVWEWCSDWYGQNYYANRPRNNPQGPGSGSSRVIRGGSWYGTASAARAALRLRYSPGFRYSYLGFRVALPAQFERRQRLVVPWRASGARARATGSAAGAGLYS